MAATERYLTDLADRLGLSGIVETHPVSDESRYRREDAYIGCEYFLQEYQGRCRSGSTRLGPNRDAAAATLRRVARDKGRGDRWECRGPVRGSCGVLHRTSAAAKEHCEQDHRDVRRGHPAGRAYSDRRPVRTVSGER